MKNKKRIMLTFREDGSGGGPYNSHKRIIEFLSDSEYEFGKLIIPKGRIGSLNIRLIKNLYNQIKEFNPDIVHISGLQLEGFYSTIATRLTSGTKAVVAIHGSVRESLEYKGIKKCIILIYEFITLLLSNQIFSVSEYIATWKILKLFKKKFFGVIYNIPLSVSTDEPILFDLDFLRKTKESHINVCVVGRVTLEKGFDTIQKIIKLARNDNINFVIIGDGKYLDCFKSFIIQNKLTNRVIITGYQKNVFPIMKECDIYLSASKHETLSMTALEAGINGLPSVVSNVGGIKEIIKNGINGFLIDMDNDIEYYHRIIQLTKDKDLRLKMGRNAVRKINEDFSLESILLKIEELYSIFD